MSYRLTRAKQDTQNGGRLSLNAILATGAFHNMHIGGRQKADVVRKAPQRGRSECQKPRETKQYILLTQTARNPNEEPWKAVSARCNFTIEDEFMDVAWDKMGDIAYIWEACQKDSPLQITTFKADDLKRHRDGVWHLFNKVHFQEFAGTGDSAFAPEGSLLIDVTDKASVRDGFETYENYMKEDPGVAFIKAAYGSSRAGVWSPERLAKEDKSVKDVDSFWKTLKSCRESMLEEDRIDPTTADAEYGHFVVQRAKATSSSFNNGNVAHMRIYFVWNCDRRQLYYNTHVRVTRDSQKGDKWVTSTAVQKEQGHIDEFLKGVEYAGYTSRFMSRMRETFSEKVHHEPQANMLKAVYFFCADVIIADDDLYAIEFNQPDLTSHGENAHILYPLLDAMRLLGLGNTNYHTGSEYVQVN